MNSRFYYTLFLGIKLFKNPAKTLTEITIILQCCYDVSYLKTYIKVHIYSFIQNLAVIHIAIVRISTLTTFN